MSLRRGATPLMGAMPSLEASNQAQIEDLVQRNRTLEHANKKLDEQVAQERERSKQAVIHIQVQWEKNQQEWKEGCEDILASYRIVQKQVELELERERTAVIKEMSVTRVEKLQRLQRDVKIKLFQMKEEELDRKIEDLEQENSSLAEEAELNLSKEREKCSQYVSRLKETREALERAVKEKKDTEAKYNKLRADRSNLEAKSGTMDTNLQRTQLQLEGMKTKMADIEHLNDEFRRKNADLTHQLERWQNLETKGGEAAEEQRKKLLDVEFKLSELREAHDKLQEESEMALAKEKRRTEKMKDTLANWESEAKEQERAAKEAKKQLAKLQKSNEKLKDELEIERARVRPPSPQKPKAPTPAASDDESEKSEEAEEEPTTRKRKTSAKPESSRATTSKPGPSTTKAPGKLQIQVARKSTGGKPPPARPKKVAAPTPIDVDVVEISDPGVEKEPAATKKRNVKGKAKAVENEEQEEEAPVPQKQKGKRKAMEETKGAEGDIEFVDKPKAAKKGSRAPSEVRETNGAKARAKPRSRAGSKQPTARPEPENEEEAEEAGPKKKKRKIISGATSGPFAFDSLNLTQFDDKINSLNIPSVLSPVRDDELVPQRSTSSFVASSFGTLIKKMPFPGRKS